MTANGQQPRHADRRHMSHSSGGTANLPDSTKVRQWVLKAGEMVLSLSQQTHYAALKQNGTPVTPVDHAIETYLLNRIRIHYPHHRILAEEQGASGDHCEFLWAIDPLDGTRAFASGLPIWGISVGVLRHGRPHWGVFYMPVLDEMVWGDEEGAFLNDQPLLPPHHVTFDSPLAFLAVPSDAHLKYDIDFRRVRCLGSTAAHLAYVARGAAIGALTRRISLWDLAGVLPVLEQTGIKLCYLSGQPWNPRHLLDGTPAAEPLIGARTDLLDKVRKTIRVRA